jgi:transketolase
VRKWKAFGFDVVEINGHDYLQLTEAFDRAWSATERPVMILANTIKGKGVDFMENNVVYHYASADSEVCKKAKESILRTMGGM